MAAVYEVLDESTGETLALKRLLPERLEGRSGALGLQREYDTLVRLSHPLIIRAFDYGVDGRLPFYTMERLRGESVSGQGALPWRDAAALVRDVASALALVHSRKLVHRDVSSRNVCRTVDGRAKLLDFGALTPMGPPRDVVGTPPFLCPESLELLPLDARADLFSLGALAYYLLTGRHSYPARGIAELGEAWKRAVLPPSASAPEVPPSLDALVMALIDLNPRARPASAAEVFDRLTSIAELPPGEAPETARAYFLSPNLVARAYGTRAFRRQLLRAERGQGGSLLVESPRGGGRSRFLSNVLLEAKLRGAIVLSADARVRPEPLGVARSLVESLRDSEPALLDEAMAADPSLAQALASAPLAPDDARRNDPENLVPAIERVARFVVDLTRSRPVVVGVDDLDACDGPSAAVVHAIADAASSKALLVIATSPAGARAVPSERLRSAGASLVLSPLKPDDTRELLSSVFGEVSHLSEVSEWVHGFSQGLPRAAMELAQHLVDTGVARYAEGTWSLPPQFDGSHLPKSVDEALDARILALGAGARRIAQALSLVGEHDPLVASEYPAIVGEADAPELFSHLNELVSASVLADHGDSYAFVNASVRAAVRRSIRAEELPLLHVRIAKAYRAGARPVAAIAAHHLWNSGAAAEAFELLVQELGEQTDYLSRGIGFLRTPEGAETLEALYEWACANAVAPADLAIVSRGVLQVASIGGARLEKYGPLILDQLRRDSGLADIGQHAAIEDPLLRIQACVSAAYARYLEDPGRETRLDPVAAIQHLATASALVLGVYARRADPAGAAGLAELVGPLRPLSPALEVIGKLVSLAASSLRGHETRQARVEVVEQTAAPVTGIDELSRIGIHLLSIYYLALEDTTQGLLVDDARLLLLDTSASYAPLAWQVRMLREYYRGDEAKAEEFRKRRDAALTGRFDVDGHLDLSFLYEASAYGTLGNLMALKRLVPAVEVLARTRPGWQPHYRLAAGNCHFLRGDHARAIAEYETGLATPGIDHHAGGILLTIRLLRALVAAGKGAEAMGRGEEALRRFRDQPIILLYRDQLELAVAGAEAAVGERAAALDHARTALSRADGRGVRGATLVDLLVWAALVAHHAGDTAWREELTRRVGELAARTGSSVFAKHHSRLLALRASAKFESVAASVGVHAPENVFTLLVEGVRSELERCKGPEARAQCALRILLEHAGARSGFLYLQGSDGLTCVAAIPETSPPRSLDERVNEWVTTVFDSDDESHTESVEASPAAAAKPSLAFVEIVTSLEEDVVLAGVAALEPSRRALTSVPRDVLMALGEGLVRAGDAMGRTIQDA